MSGALRWSGTIKSKTKGSWTYVGRNAAGLCYQKLCSYYQIITARPCHPEEEEENEEEEQHQKGEIRFFENIFSLDYLTFWLSYSIYSIITSQFYGEILCKSRYFM